MHHYVNIYILCHSSEWEISSIQRIFVQNAWFIARDPIDLFFFHRLIYLWWDLTWLLYSSMLCYIYCNHIYIYIHVRICIYTCMYMYIYIHVYVYIYVINIHLYVVLCSSWLRSSFNHLREHVDLKLINLIKKWFYLKSFRLSQKGRAQPLETGRSWEFPCAVGSHRHGWNMGRDLDAPLVLPKKGWTKPC